MNNKLYDYEKFAVEFDPHIIVNYEKLFRAAMNNDFNTVEALHILDRMSAQINLLKKIGLWRAASVLGTELVRLGKILGILQESPTEYFQKGFCDEQKQQINQLILERNQAKKSKNWPEADSIREKLSAMNIILEDSIKDGELYTFWRRAK